MRDINTLFSRGLRGGRFTKFEVNQTNLKRVILPAASSASSDDLRSDVSWRQPDVRPDVTTKTVEKFHLLRRNRQSWVGCPPNSSYESFSHRNCQRPHHNVEPHSTVDGLSFKTRPGRLLIVGWPLRTGPGRSPSRRRSFPPTYARHSWQNTVLFGIVIVNFHIILWHRIVMKNRFHQKRQTLQSIADFLQGWQGS